MLEAGPPARGPRPPLPAHLAHGPGWRDHRAPVPGGARWLLACFVFRGPVAGVGVGAVPSGGLAIRTSRRSAALPVPAGPVGAGCARLPARGCAHRLSSPQVIPPGFREGSQQNARPPGHGNERSACCRPGWPVAAERPTTRAWKQELDEGPGGPAVLSQQNARPPGHGNSPAAERPHVEDAQSQQNARPPGHGNPRRWTRGHGRSRPSQQNARPPGHGNSWGALPSPLQTLVAAERPTTRAWKRRRLQGVAPHETCRSRTPDHQGMETRRWPRPSPGSPGTSQQNARPPGHGNTLICR